MSDIAVFAIVFGAGMAVEAFRYQIWTAIKNAMRPKSQPSSSSSSSNSTSPKSPGQ